MLGLARSGLATVASLLASGAQVTAWDRQPEARKRVADRVTLANPLEIDLAPFDALIVSPGVPLNTHPVATRAAAAGVPVIGDMELFALARPDLPPHKVVGITGTNGKSTTVALITHLLKSAGIPALMGGNIGLPVLSREALPEGGVYVLELSSYQIDLTRSLACEAAGLTNVTPDHLDRYADFEDYAFSKGRLFAMQGSGQFAAFGCGDPATRAVRDAAAVQRPDGRAVCADLDRFAGDADSWPSLQGPHNRENAAIAIEIAGELGLSDRQIAAGLKSFGGLPHRMERLGEFEGISFVNDSKATNPASAAPALAAFPPDDKDHGVDSTPRIHWIVGGLPKGDDLGECAQQLGNVAAAYTIGEAGPHFAELLAGSVHVEQCELMCEAARRAFGAARPGDVVLLSPACASFDQFRDYEMRGESFRAIVNALADDGKICCVGDAKS